MKMLRFLGCLVLCLAVTETANALTPEQFKRWEIYRPHPRYWNFNENPEFRPGPGMLLVSFDATSGTVIRVDIIKSTGNGPLDRDFASAYKRWTFKPGVLPKDYKIKVPINVQEIHMLTH